MKQYVVRELYWELEQHPTITNPLKGICPENLEVITLHGYDDFRVFIAGNFYDVHLSWQKLVPPIIKHVTNI